MTPLEIEVLLALHYSADGYTGVSLGSRTYERAILDFFNAGLIKAHLAGQSGDRDWKYELTARGNDTVQALLAVPMHAA